MSEKSDRVLRVAKTDDAKVRVLVSEIVTFPCSQVVGRALWNVGKEPDLTKITEVKTAAEIDLHGDFGHIFGTTAEVRWRRIDEAHYDILILSDTPLEIEGADALGEGWNIRERNLMVKHDKELPRVSAQMYLAPNGAVQFVSYRMKEAR
ncbi:MAG: hypothetical protein WCF99_07535 [Chloroflexales bacterium]